MMMDPGSLIMSDGQQVDQSVSICAHLLKGKLPGWATKTHAEMAALRKLAVIVSLGLYLAGMFFMLIGTRRVLDLDAEDAAYGDGCGCPPPSYHTFSEWVNDDEFDSYQQAEKNSSELRCQGSDPTSKPSWCTHSSGGSDEGNKKDDGESCQSSAECEGVCAGGKCVLSDYAGDLEVSLNVTLALWTVFYCILSLVVAVLLTSHRSYFPAVWKVTVLFVIAAGAVFLYGGQAAEGSLTMAPLEFIEPIFGFSLVFSLPMMALVAAWGGALSFIAWIFGLFALDGDSLFVNLYYGSVPMIFPVVMGMVAAIALVLHMFGGAGGQDGLVARLSQGVVVQPQISSQRLFRTAHVFGMFGMLAVLNLLWSDSYVWYHLGSMTKFADCGDFSDAELRGVEELDYFICLDYPKAMTCGGLPDGYDGGSDYDVCDSSSNVRITPAEAGGYNTGLAGTTDPLVAQFRHGMWIYKIGLFFITIGFAATIFATTQPEKNTRTATTKHKQPPGWRVFAVQKFSWTVPLAVAGATLLIAIGAHGMFNLPAEDFLYGDAAGGSPPLGPLDDFRRLIIDVPGVVQSTDFNQSSHSGGAPNDPDVRSKEEGSACDHDIFCVSGICKPKTSNTADGMICVLDDYADDYGSTGSVNQDIWETAGEAPFWRPVYGSLLVAFAGLLPAEFDGKRVVSPGVAVGMATGSFLIALRAWSAWAFRPAIAGLDTWRGIYTSLVDCSDFDGEEMIGASLINYYSCYEGPAASSSSVVSDEQFTVESGSCTLSRGNTCVSSPNSPAAYDSSSCRISVSGTAAVTATTWDLSSGDGFTVGNSYFSGIDASDSGPSNERVTTSNEIDWNPYMPYGTTNSHTGWTLCLYTCDAACQSGGYHGGMSATLEGIHETDGSRINPVLRSWVRHCTTFLFGLFLNFVTSIAALALAFPLHWPAVKMAADLVCCWGRCCGAVAQSEAEAKTAGLPVEPGVFQVVEPLATLEPSQAAQSTSQTTMPQMPGQLSGQMPGFTVQQPPKEPADDPAATLQYSTASPVVPSEPPLPSTGEF